MSRSTKGLSIVFDISSSSVGGAVIFLSSKSLKPKILHTFRTEIVLKEDIDFERFQKSTLLTLEGVLKNIEKNIPSMPEKIFCFLDSPWVLSQIRTIKMKKNSPFKFTESLAKSFIQKEVKNFENFELKELENNNQKMQILEKESFQTKLNGYKTNKPFNKKISSFEVDLFFSLSQEEILKKIEHQIRKFFNIDIMFRSFTFSAFSATRDLFPKYMDYIYIDIRGEISNLSIIRNESILETVSFPFGYNSVISSLSKNLKKDKVEIETMFNLFIQDKLESNAKKSFNKYLNESFSLWSRYYVNSLAKISKNKKIPSNIFFTAPSATASFFEKEIRREEWGQSFLINKEFNVIILSNKVLSTVISAKEGVSLDPFLSLESFFISRI